jgi:hypothetical protein
MLGKGAAPSLCLINCPSPTAPKLVISSASINLELHAGDSV